MALWAIPVGMAALGAYKGQQDRAQAKQDRLAEAEVARWSPWTGMQPARVGMPAGELGGAIQGGLAGASLMQSFDGGGKGEAPKAEPTAQATPGQYSLTADNASMAPNYDYSKYENSPIMQQYNAPQYGGPATQYAVPNSRYNLNLAQNKMRY